MPPIVFVVVITTLIIFAWNLVISKRQDLTSRVIESLAEGLSICFIFFILFILWLICTIIIGVVSFLARL